MRQVRNKILAAWISESPRHRLSYLVNNNPNGVMEWLRKSGVPITDINADGVIGTDELYAALTTYAQSHFNGIQNFLNHAGSFIAHNDYAPAKWNIYKLTD